MNKLKSWLQFTKERFEPISHFLMITLFFTAHIMLYKVSHYSLPPVHLILSLYLGTTLFFFKLRLYDEIKDYELDLIINPTRPLPRGLLFHTDLYQGIAFCILFELILFGIAGGNSFFNILLTISYSLLMFKEFYISKYIRPHLTTYALSHTIVTILLSMSLLGAMTASTFFELPVNAYLFAIISWLAFNIFEFGRKTYLDIEERDQVESYSKIFGKTGAFMLIFTQMVFILILITFMDLKSALPFEFFILTILGISFIVGVAFIASNKAPWGAIYRANSSAVIIIIYLGFIVQFLR